MIQDSLWSPHGRASSLLETSPKMLSVPGGAMVVRRGPQFCRTTHNFKSSWYVKSSNFRRADRLQMRKSVFEKEKQYVPR